MRGTRAALGLVASVIVAGGGCLQIIGYEDPTPYVADAGTTTSSATTSGTGFDAGTCNNGTKDGDETGKDCGGSCPACPAGEGCRTGADCQSNSCGSAGVCVQPECDDSAKNGDETDVDCGGSTCPACAFGKTCTKNDDCVTGYCDGSTCDARPVVKGLTNPNSLAVDKVNVYWADGDLGTITMADIASGTSQDAAKGLSSPKGLVIVPGQASSLYPTWLSWVETNAGLVRRTCVGCASASNQSVSTTKPQSVVAGARYWMGTGPSNPRCLMTSDWSGTSPKAQCLIPVFGDVYPYIVEAPASQQLVLAADNRTGFAKSNLWVVQEMAGATPTMLATYSDLNSACWQIAVDGSYVYWADDVAGTVAKVGLAGGTPQPIATGQEKPTDVAIDTLYVYWLTQGTTAGTGSVMKAPLAGGAPVVLASGQEAPRALFATQSEVYWLSGANGQVSVRSVKK